MDSENFPETLLTDEAFNDCSDVRDGSLEAESDLKVGDIPLVNAFFAELIERRIRENCFMGIINMQKRLTDE